MALVEAISCAAFPVSSARMAAVAMAAPQCHACVGVECREIRSRSQLMGVALETGKSSVAFGRARDDSTRRGMSVISRVGGPGGAGPPRPRITMPGRRGPAQQQEPSNNDGPLMNQDIRFSFFPPSLMASPSWLKFCCCNLFFQEFPRKKI